MHAHTLVDISRLKALGVARTFDGVGFYLEDTAYKFIVVRGELVIGAFANHSELYAAWSLRDVPSGDNLQERVEDLAQLQWNQRDPQVVAAGKVGEDGVVTGWNSECFQLVTPPDARGEIVALIGKLFHSGELRLR